MKTALIIGATGMVGKQVLYQLIASEEYEKIVSFVRTSSGISHSKLTEHIINFDEVATWKDLVKGDVLFSCLGTTLAKAKSKSAQYKVDFSYQYSFAKIASENQVPCYILVSSAGANTSSSNFYIRMKGELDEAVMALNFKSISIIRPGQLSGERTENRLGEKIGLKVMRGINALGLFAKYKPVEASQVAKTMLNAAEKIQTRFYTLDEVHHG